MNFKSISADEIKDNAIKLIRDDWMLVAAGTKGKANSMTVSWGMLGHIWYKDVAVCVVRPQRYTYKFMEENDTYTLSVFPEKYRAILREYGTKSGTEINKVEGGVLTPLYKHGTLYYEEARLVLFCKKIYVQDVQEDCFLDSYCLEKSYKQKDFHRTYYGEIIEVLVK